MSLVVDIEAANTEEESKMKYKMQRLDKLKFRADAKGKKMAKMFVSLEMNTQERVGQ